MSAVCSFTPIRRRDAPELRLFCFHHAGGNAASFAAWADAFPERIEIWAAQLPYRFGKTYSAAPQITALLPDMIARFAASFDAGASSPPFAFYGHSLGALVAFELAHALVAVRHQTPLALAVSGHRAPDRLLRRQPMHDLDDRAFVERLHALGGVPDGLLDNPSLSSFLLPMLRSDLRLSETYAYVPRAPLAIPLFGFRGEDDPLLNAEEFDAWERHTSTYCRLRTLTGGHFFDAGSLRALQQDLSLELLGLLRGSVL